MIQPPKRPQPISQGFCDSDDPSTVPSWGKGLGLHTHNPSVIGCGYPEKKHYLGPDGSPQRQAPPQGAHG